MNVSLVVLVHEDTISYSSFSSNVSLILAYFYENVGAVRQQLTPYYHVLIKGKNGLGHNTHFFVELCSEEVEVRALGAEIDGLSQVIEGIGQFPHLSQDDCLGVEGPDVVLAQPEQGREVIQCSLVISFQ